MIKYISLISIINLIVFIIVLWFRKPGNKETNRLLSGFLVLILITQLVYFVWTSGFYKRFIWLVQLDYIASFLFGYMFFLFVLSSIGEKIKLSYKSIIHFILPILAIIHYINFQLNDYNYKINFVENAYSKFPMLEYVLNIGLGLSFLTYLIVSYFKIKQYQKKIHQCLSEIHKLNLSWIKNLVLWFIIISALVSFGLNILSVNIKQQYNELIGTATLFVFYVILFAKTINQPNFYEKKELIRSINDKDCDIKDKSRQKISEEKINEIFSKLSYVLKNEKLFLKPKLTLKELADNLKSNTHELSYIINKKTNGNFYKLINSFRVEEAKEQLINSENTNLTIEAIGLKCGFNSTSTFFDVFKKMTNQTPLQYRNKNNKEIPI